LQAFNLAVTAPIVIIAFPSAALPITPKHAHKRAWVPKAAKRVGASLEALLAAS
jgi:hypothetical protein